MIEFKDGNKYRIYYPTMIAGGVTMGKKTFNIKNSALIVDLNNESGKSFTNSNGFSSVILANKL